MHSIALVSLISGLISIIFVDVIFLVLFSSGWLFFIIPAVICWSIKKFAKINKEELFDEESFEKMAKKTGLICAGSVILAIILALLPVIIILGIYSLLLFLTSFWFIIMCIICIYVSYTKGVEVITNAYYDTYE